ncbi:MAG: hypothetical protein AAGF68_08550 [Pseudomonadota bacterium]
MKRAALFCILIASAAHAQDLSTRQQAAFDVILPELEVSLKEQGGETLVPLASMLATCVVTEARRSEVRSLGDGEFSDADTALMNDIMNRPGVQGCVAKAAGQG